MPSTPTTATSGTATPTTSQFSQQQQGVKSVSPGVLTIGVIQAQDLRLPPDAKLPSAIQHALEARQQQASSNGGGRAAVRESMQRKQMWWLPYIVLEFDKNEIMVDALGGDLDCPAWHYKARLWVITRVMLLIQSKTNVKHASCCS